MTGVNRTSRWGAALAAVLVATTLAACGSDDKKDESAKASSSTDSSKPFRVQVLAALSGPAGAAGTASKDAVEVAAEQINASGGIGGRKVVVDVADTGGAATSAVAAIQPKLTGEDKPDLVYPGSTSDETLALCPLLGRAKVLSIGITADSKVGDPSICPYNFSVSLAAKTQVKLIGDYFKSKGYKRAGLLTANDAYGRSISDAAKKEFPAMGIDVASAQQFKPDAVSIIQQWQALQKAKVDVVLLEGQGPAIAKALDGRRQVGFDVPVVGGTGAAQANPGALVASPAALEGVTLQTYGVQVKDQAFDAKRFNEAAALFKKRNGGKFEVGMHIYTLSYDTLAAAQTAARVAKATDSDSLRKALEGFGATPPSDPTWLTNPNLGFSPESHFPATGTFAAAQAAKQQDGVLQPAS